MDKLESPHIPDRNVKWGGMENSMAVSHKVKRVTAASSKSTLRNILKRNENMSTKNLCTNVHSNIICNSQRGKTTHCPSTDEGKKCDIFMQWGITQL